MPSAAHRSPSQRRGLRLAGYDYTSPGAYFITICTDRRRRCFGHVEDGAMRLSAAGRVAQDQWDALPNRFQGLELDDRVVMPDHLHGIIVLVDRGPSATYTHLSEIVRAFKAVTAHALRSLGLRDFAWQRNYYERVVRNESELNRIRQYIRDNPANWSAAERIPAIPKSSR